MGKREKMSKESVFLAAIREIEKKIDYEFEDKSLLRQAFTRNSYCNEQNARRKDAIQSNEVLEFFGDGILSAAIITFMIRDCAERYENGIRTRLDEGAFTNIKSKLSDKKNLSRCMMSLGIQKYLLMGEGDEKLGIENEPSVLEDLFESVIAAVYIDSGMKMDAVLKTVVRMLDVSEYISSPGAEASAKNLLQEWCADRRRRLAAPRYETVSESGPEHKRIYERACYVGERLCGTAKGKNRKIADALAAKAALELLMAEERRAARGEVNEEAVLKLRGFAARQNKPYPEFRDLGEVREDGVGAVFAVECRFDGRVERGEGYSKREARALAAAEMLRQLHSTTSEKRQKAQRRKPQSGERKRDERAAENGGSHRAKSKKPSREK